MRFTAKWAVCSLAALLLGGVAAAQQTQTQQTLQSDPSIKQRKENQQDRIANGMQSGQLTPGEASRLENKEAAINHEIKADKTANGGTLAPAEKAKINSQQNHLSKDIYAQKHDAQKTTYGNNQVDQRRENQQDRIAQGVRSGKLTAGEAAKLENQERGINQQVHADRAANGGKLTAGEKAQINHEQNRESKKIYREKHNQRTQGGAKPKS